MRGFSNISVTSSLGVVAASGASDVRSKEDEQTSSVRNENEGD